jgi:hypothetical protein
MLKKINKIIFILILFLTIICTSSCIFSSKANIVTFENGDYEFTGETLEFEEVNEKIAAYLATLDEEIEFNAFSISYLKLTFTEVNKDDYDIVKETFTQIYKSPNVIINRANDNVYHVDFYIEDKDHNGYLCDFIVSDYFYATRWDHYELEVDISQMLNIEGAKFYFELGCRYNHNEKPVKYDLYYVNVLHGRLRINDKYFGLNLQEKEFEIYRGESE